jgi:hypothetical protein
MYTRRKTPYITIGIYHFPEILEFIHPIAWYVDNQFIQISYLYVDKNDFTSARESEDGTDCVECSSFDLRQSVNFG